MKLLHLDSSILGTGSVSRALTAEVVEAQRKLHPDLQVTYRDLAADPLQHLSGTHLMAPESEGLDTATGAAVLEELFATDLIVLGAPMYNFSIPSQLKAWIDRIAVAGKTFHYTENGPEGLVKGKKLFLISSRGGAYEGTPLAALDHQEAYLKTVLGFIGITDIEVIRAENVARSELREPSIAAAKQAIAQLAA
ncbi:FMN-dependent NADH-azoreductase [Haloferula luteola]|uniref:FMN dependent NADH:quinone oxidoreductase n=1 Tax=Haloferula luteola TaxID=595692 RepID=A0A840V3Z1_9BACT|nr:NAD(P)H-dependent oxidoreductase [Haloferula luteola]MBB5353017.1 FMN-dependent NADH-azoreductase [Haloferula luteola]